MENYFELNHKNIYVFGVLGKLERNLQELGSLCKNEKLEFAPVIDQDGRDFLPGFYYPPVIDITFDRHPDKESSIVAYTLNKDKALGVIEEIINKSGLKVIKPDSQFVSDITSEMIVEITTYTITEGIVKSLAPVAPVTFEQMWDYQNTHTSFNTKAILKDKQWNWQQIN